MIRYSKFDNYGLRQPFDPTVRESAGRTVEGTSLTDIRAQAIACEGLLAGPKALLRSAAATPVQVR